MRTGSTRIRIKSCFLRKRHKSNIWSKASEGWMSSLEQTAQNRAHRKVLAPWQDKNTHKWDGRGICGASNYLLTWQKVLLWKGRALFGLSGVSVERCDVCRGCSVSVFMASSKHALIAAHLLGSAAPGRCSGWRRCRSKVLVVLGALQSLCSAEPLLLVLAAAASSGTRHPHTDGSSPAEIQLLHIIQELIKGKAALNWIVGATVCLAVKIGIFVSVLSQWS